MQVNTMNVPVADELAGCCTRFLRLVWCVQSIFSSTTFGITQCYLPPGRGDIPAFTTEKLYLDLATLERDLVG